MLMFVDYNTYLNIFYTRGNAYFCTEFVENTYDVLTFAQN